MRETRRLDITKQQKIKIANGIPSKADGNNGDIQIRNTNFGVRLYAKINNKWYYVSMNTEG